MSKLPLRELWVPRLKVGGLLVGLLLFCFGITWTMGWYARSLAAWHQSCRESLSAALHQQRLETGNWPVTLDLNWIPQACHVLKYQVEPMKVDFEGATYRVTQFRANRRAGASETFELQVPLSGEDASRTPHP